MQSPMYVLTQNAQPGMLIEIDGERFMVQAVDTDFPTVTYTTPRGRERVEYGAEARVVTVSAHPAALPASSVTYATPRFSDTLAKVEARTGTYVAAVSTALDDPEVDSSGFGLRQTCTECDTHVDAMTEAERGAHEIVELEERWILVGCEGYWLVDPAAVGMVRGNWQDWRELHCGDCAATLAQHCVECNECPMTDGPCWCGAASYKSEGRPAQSASEAPGGTDAPAAPAEPAATGSEGGAVSVARDLRQRFNDTVRARARRTDELLADVAWQLLLDAWRVIEVASARADRPATPSRDEWFAALRVAIFRAEYPEATSTALDGS